MINVDEIIDDYNKNLLYKFDNSKELEELKLELWGYRQAILRDDNLLGLQLQINELQARIDKAIKDLFELKDMIYKPETREINFDIQNKISSIIKDLGSDKE